jgi:hypothetical protein
MIPYSEKLKHPKWQRKRLEVLQRDNFTCVKCGDTETELHVNHLKYLGEPYETPLSALETLCKNCHKIHHSIPDKKIIRVLKEYDPYYDEVYCIEYIVDGGFDYAFAHIKLDGSVDFISTYEMVSRDNLNYQLKKTYKILVDFLDSELDFFDFGGINKFANEVLSQIENSPHYKQSGEVWVDRTSHSLAIECFTVIKIKGIFFLEYNGGAS